MTNRFEDKIRDYLADNLETVEKGLVLVKKEYEIPSPHGAGGRIDIVARDVFSNVVIIEIKRSDQSARQALNEIHKYTALFKIQQGLDESRVRLLVISTEWHELLLPFSEFAATTHYSVQGILITALPTGIVTGLSQVPLVKKIGALEISRAQAGYLYHASATRDKHEADIVAAVKSVGIEDFVVFHCDYSGKNNAVVFPYSLYLCFSSPLPCLTATKQEEIKKRIRWDNDLDEPDENFLVAINESMSHNWDDFEIGYPEKFVSICQEWSVSVSVRSGRLDPKQSVLSDKEVLELAQAIKGGNCFYIATISSPRFSAAWSNLRQELDLVLRGNKAWEKIVPLYLNEIEINSPSATVSVSVYNPANLLFSLYYAFRDEDISRCPQLQIVVEDSHSETVRVLLGFLSWTGRNVSSSPADIINRVYKHADRWLIASNFGETHVYDDKVIGLHNLEVNAVEWVFVNKEEHGPIQLIIKNRTIARNPFDAVRHKPLLEFITMQKPYLSSLQLFMENTIVGLADSA